MKSICLISFLFFGLNSFGQDYSPFKSMFNKLQQFSLMTDSIRQKEEIQKLFSTLREQNQIPFIIEDSVLFLYEGKTTSVSWMGDFNGWGYDDKFQNRGKKIANTNI